MGLLELVRTLAHHDGLAVLVALHDLNLAARYADRIALLVEGRVKALGSPGEVLRPELISEAYHLPVQVIPNPLDGSPLVLPDAPSALRSLPKSEINISAESIRFGEARSDLRSPVGFGIINQQLLREE